MHTREEESSSGRSKDGTKAVTAYFIMGRSENSRNRVFVEDGDGIRTQAFDPSKLTDPESDHLRTCACVWATRRSSPTETRQIRSMS